MPPFEHQRDRTAMAFAWKNKILGGKENHMKKSGRSWSSEMYWLACRNIARTVPASSSLCCGTVSVWRCPLVVSRRSFICEPRWEWITKPKETRIETMSSPASLFGLGIKGFQLHRYQECGVGSKPKLLKILTIQMQGNSFLEVADGFVECYSLSDNVDFFAFGNVVIVPFADEGFYGVLELSHENTRPDNEFVSEPFYRIDE